MTHTRIKWNGPLGFNPIAGRRVLPGHEYDLESYRADFLIAEGKAVLVTPSKEPPGAKPKARKAEPGEEE